MEAKSLLERASDIYRFMNSVGAGGSGLIDGFIEGETKVWSRLIKAFRTEEGCLDDSLIRPVTDAWEVAFALGYVIGNMTNVTNPEIIEDVEAVKNVIRDKGLLPYLPREKKGE